MSSQQECAPLSSANLERLELTQESKGASLSDHYYAHGLGHSSDTGDVNRVARGLSGMTLNHDLSFYPQRVSHLSDPYTYNGAPNSPTRSETGPSSVKQVTRSAELPMHHQTTYRAENLRDTQDREDDKQIVQPYVTAHPLRPKGSNISGRHQVGGKDAQGLYPSAACIFIANLPENKDDVALEAALYKVFSLYGTCFMKIRRDNKKMPFAFCQYTKIEDAKAAMEYGRGSEIFGRPCRVELTKGNRTYIIHKRVGDITIEEAREALEVYGPLDHCDLVKPDVLESLNIKTNAALVEFQKYDEERDLNAAFRRHKTFVVNIYDPKKLSQGSRDSAETYLRQFEIDRRSAFVGNLPLDVNEEQLRSVFSDIGEIQNIQIVQKPINAGPGTRVFAFIEFETEDLPDIAVERWDNELALGGQPLRVERKVGRDLLRNTPQARRVRSRPSMRFKSPEERPHVAEERRFTPKHTPSGTDQGVSSPSASTAIHTPSTLPATPNYGMMAYPHSTGQPFVAYGGPAGIDGMAPSPEATSTIPMHPMMNPFYYWPGMPYYPDPNTGRVFSAFPNNPMSNLAVPYEDPFSTPPQFPVSTSHQGAEQQDHQESAA